MSVEKRLLTTGEVAEILGTNKQKVCQLIAAARLRGIDLSTATGSKPRWGIPTDSVEQFLNGGHQSPPLKPEKTARRQRIDAHVPKVFG
jgi:hypothetical protein